MKYVGELYGKVAGKYIKMDIDSSEYDRLVEKAKMWDDLQKVRTMQFNSVQNKVAGIEEPLPVGSDHGPEDLNEFLQCLKIDVDGIDYAKHNIVAVKNDEDSSLIQRGSSYMLEDSCRTELYRFVKQYLHWYLPD